MKLFASILLAAGTVAMTSAARALPISPAPSIPGAIVQVGWACGPGRHLTPWGRCVPTRRFYLPWGYWGPTSLLCAATLLAPLASARLLARLVKQHARP